MCKRTEMVLWCNSVVLLLGLINHKSREWKKKIRKKKKKRWRRRKHWRKLLVFFSNKITYPNQTVIGIRFFLLPSLHYSLRQLLPSSIIRKARVVLDWFLCLSCPCSLFLNNLIIAHNEINHLTHARHLESI